MGDSHCTGFARQSRYTQAQAGTSTHLHFSTMHSSTLTGHDHTFCGNIGNHDADRAVTDLQQSVNIH